MLRACSVHQLASLGFILLSFKGAPIGMTVMLSTATFLFPYVVYYQAIIKKGQRVLLTSMVPKGGVMHIAFWVYMGLFYYTQPVNAAAGGRFGGLMGLNSKNVVAGVEDAGTQTTNSEIKME